MLAIFLLVNTHHHCVGLYRDEGSGRCSGPESDVWEARHDGGSFVLLSCKSYPTHTPLTVNGAGGIDTGAQPDTDEADYCNSLLHSSHNSSIQTLQRVQNKAVMIVLQAPRRCHANPLLCSKKRAPF